MRSLLFYVHLVLSAILMFPRLLLLRSRRSKLTEERYDELANDAARKFVLSQIKWSGSKFHITGLENIPKTGPVCYVANHQSFFDVGVFVGYLPYSKGFISKVELLKIPIIAQWMKELKCIFIDRNDIRKSAEAIMKGIELLKTGHSMVIFPEGTRSRGKAPQPLKGGSFKLPIRAKVPIVPVTIEGTYRACEGNNYWIKKADIYVTIHPAIETAGLTLPEAQKIPEMVSNIVLSPLPAPVA